MNFQRYMLIQVTWRNCLTEIKGVPTMINCHNFASTPGAPTLETIMCGENTMNNKSEVIVERLTETVLG